MTLAVDAFTAEVAGGLDAARVRCILLKGPALRELLYPDGARPYEDCDLMFDPDRDADAERVLRHMGFRPEETPRVATVARPVATSWARGWERVDVHRSFWGLAASPRQVWAALEEGAVRGTVARRGILMPSRQARLMLVALHAVHHGPSSGQPIADLERALHRERHEVWAEAHGLARRLGGERAFAAAFTLLPAGPEVARAAGIPRLRTIEAAVTAAGLPVSEGFERLTRTDGVGARARLALAELFPSAEFMRWRYAVARRGAAGLSLAYPMRLVSITVSVGRVLRAWLALR